MGNEQKKPRKVPAHKRGFHVAKSGEVPAGRQFKKKRVFRNNLNKLVADMADLACKRNGWTKAQLAYYLRMGTTDLTLQKGRVSSLCAGEFTALRYDKFKALARKAGVPPAIAVVLWAKAQIPDEYERDRKLVGLCARGVAKNNFRVPPEDAEQVRKDFLDEVKTRAYIVPNEVKQIHSGMTLKKSERRLH